MAMSNRRALATLALSLLLTHVAFAAPTTPEDAWDEISERNVKGYRYETADDVTDTLLQNTSPALAPLANPNPIGQPPIGPASLEMAKQAEAKSGYNRVPDWLEASLKGMTPALQDSEGKFDKATGQFMPTQLKTGCPPYPNNNLGDAGENAILVLRGFGKSPLNDVDLDGPYKRCALMEGWDHSQSKCRSGHDYDPCASKNVPVYCNMHGNGIAKIRMKYHTSIHHPEHFLIEEEIKKGQPGDRIKSFYSTKFWTIAGDISTGTWGKIKTYKEGNLMVYNEGMDIDKKRSAKASALIPIPGATISCMCKGLDQYNTCKNNS